MFALPNGCYVSKISVHPKNWQRGGSEVKNWYIHYKYYSPDRKTRKVVIIKGMNIFSSIHQRRDATKKLVEHEHDLLFRQGFNAFTRRLETPEDSSYEIHPSTPFAVALRQVLARLKKSKSTMADLKSVVLAMDRAIDNLGLRELEISEVRRRHIKSIFAFFERTNPKWSADRHNKFRSYLMILFKELMELEAIDINPVRDISKRKTVRRIRVTLNQEERIKVDHHLRTRYPSFHRFLHIFFHSGARITELVRLRYEDIDLEHQRYKRVIKKGKSYQEIWTPIKDIALPYWEEIYNLCSPGQILFSDGLNPGDREIRSDQITKRWKAHVKAPVASGGLGITADFYSLKHLNTDETAALIGINAARLQNAHKSEGTTRIYAIGQKGRDDEMLKRVSNPFA